MSYHPTGLTPEEHRAADIDLRREMLAVQKREIESGKVRAFWTAMAAVATAFVPLATFFGLQRMTRKR
jgi:hypothetical protein